MAEYFGLSDTALDILCGMNEIGRPCTQKELCGIWYLSKQTVCSCSKQLVIKGYVEATPSKSNFREKLLTLTPNGRELCAVTAKRVRKAELAAFEKLSPDERVTLIELTKKHIDCIDKEFKKILENEV